jgi:uncharacterized protein with ParB-like and HNH nuclease domain
MQAKETKLQDIIEGTKQYVIPLFQRTYSWTAKEWEVLWKDIVELSEMENPRTHFIGSIVSLPTTSVPEGVAKYLLIDGQQRLTTIFIFLTLLRNKARESQNTSFAEEINNTLLVNPYKKDHDYFKLMPTQVDRETYQNFVKGKPNESENQITKAYVFFEKKLKQDRIELETLKKITTNYFSVVSIVLDADDNPYLVFESLNAKGRPLTQADLIRNYFFMRIHVDAQEDAYSSYWQPMQSAFGDDLTEYIRHYLMRSGSIIKQGDVYYELKEIVTASNAIEYLEQLKVFSIYYQRLKYPEANEPDLEIRKRLTRLNKFEVTTAYPLLLNFYDRYFKKGITQIDFVSILKTLENYLIRRFVCNVPTNQLNKIFPAVSTALAKYPGNLANGFKSTLQGRGYPKDSEFFNRFKETRFYGGGDRVVKTKLILETLEENFAHKEAVPFNSLTIEHVMPQTLSNWWKNELGEEYEETHEIFLHTIGNLTLTAYNTELSNDSFHVKKKTYNDSHLELNKHFALLDHWKREQIEARSEALAESALEIWKYFGQEDTSTQNSGDRNGNTPYLLKIMGQNFPVNNWRDVLQETFNSVAELEPEKFEILANKFPRYISKDKSKFKRNRELENGYFIQVDLKSTYIKRICYSVIEEIELTTEEWEVAVR